VEKMKKTLKKDCFYFGGKGKVIVYLQPLSKAANVLLKMVIW